MYITAIEEGWTGLKLSPDCAQNNQNCEPDGLLDTSINVQNGGGSIDIGAIRLVKSYKKVALNKNKFIDMDEYENTWKTLGLKGYNDATAYRQEVMDVFYHQFLPTTQSTIVQ